MEVALERGCEFRIDKTGCYMPKDWDDLPIAFDAIWDIVNWLGLSMGEYLRLLPVEREDIFLRADRRIDNE